MNADSERTVDDYNAMADIYAEEADRNPMNASYERPAMLEMAGDLSGRRVEIPDPPADYFATMLLTDTWNKGGRDFTVRFYHRPLGAIVAALADAGFAFERIHEPTPDRDSFAATPALYERMRRGPWFLFLRAIKR